MWYLLSHQLNQVPFQLASGCKIHLSHTSQTLLGQTYFPTIPGSKSTHFKRVVPLAALVVGRDASLKVVSSFYFATILKYYSIVHEIL